MVRAALFAIALSMAAGAVAQPDSATKAPKKAVAAKKAPAATKPAWAELTAEHQQVLAPLKPDWESLDPDRKKKWIGIAKRYPKMKPEEQARVQKRMQAWASLTVEQRRQARENYRQLAKKVPPEKRSKLRERWAEYQSLPPHQRDSLVAEPPQPDPAARPKHKK